MLYNTQDLVARGVMEAKWWVLNMGQDQWSSKVCGGVVSSLQVPLCKEWFDLEVLLSTLGLEAR